MQEQISEERGLQGSGQMHQLQWGDLGSLFPCWCSLWDSTSGPVMVPFSAGLLSLSILEQIKVGL